MREGEVRPRHSDCKIFVPSAIVLRDLRDLRIVPAVFAKPETLRSLREAAEAGRVG